MNNAKPNLKALLDCLQTIAPLEYAEDWDNVGLLIEPLEPRPIGRVLLTIDLTEPVADEAIELGVDVVVAYHPILFAPLRMFSRSRPHDRAVMKLVKADIAVYSPHTALDAAPGGVNDWLAETLGTGEIAVLRQLPDRPEGVGMGRLLTLDEPMELDAVADLVRTGLGIDRLRIAESESGCASIENIAVCAGAGADVLCAADAGLYLTGEMKHHDVLAAVQNGVHVILCGHTNTERGYLPVLARRIGEELVGVEPIITTRDHDPFDCD